MTMKHSDLRRGFEEGTLSRPEYCEDEHLKWLDELRESGRTNMIGARPFLMDEFGELGDREASGILAYWIKSFGNPKR